MTMDQQAVLGGYYLFIVVAIAVTLFCTYGKRYALWSTKRRAKAKVLQSYYEQQFINDVVNEMHEKGEFQ